PSAGPNPWGPRTRSRGAAVKAQVTSVDASSLWLDSLEAVPRLKFLVRGFSRLFVPKQAVICCCPFDRSPAVIGDRADPVSCGCFLKALSACAQNPYRQLIMLVLLGSVGQLPIIAL